MNIAAALAGTSFFEQPDSHNQSAEPAALQLTTNPPLVGPLSDPQAPGDWADLLNDPAVKSHRARIGRDGLDEAHGISAEAESLRSLDHRPDRLVLLASATPRGLAAATAVAACLAETVCVHATQAAFVGEQGNPPPAGRTKLVPHADVVRIEHLDSSAVADFARAARDIGQVLKRSARLAGQDGRLDLHVTGGYKATIPIALCLMAYVGKPPGLEVLAWCTHLADRARTTAKPLDAIPVPIPPMSPGVIDAIQALRQDQVPAYKDHQGFLFNGQVETPMCSALRDVLPGPHA